MATSREEYIQELARLATTQDLSEDLQAQTRVLTVVFTILATVFVILRFYGRWSYRISLGADDWWMLISWVLLVGNMIINLICKSTVIVHVRPCVSVYTREQSFQRGLSNGFGMLTS